LPGDPSSSRPTIPEELVSTILDDARMIAGSIVFAKTGSRAEDGVDAFERIRESGDVGHIADDDTRRRVAELAGAFAADLAKATNLMPGLE